MIIQKNLEETVKVSSDAKEKLKSLVATLPKQKGTRFYETIQERLAARDVIRTIHQVRNVVYATTWDDEIVDEIVAFGRERQNRRAAVVGNLNALHNEVFGDGGNSTK